MVVCGVQPEVQSASCSTRGRECNWDTLKAARRLSAWPQQQLSASLSFCFRADYSLLQCWTMRVHCQQGCCAESDLFVVVASRVDGTWLCCQLVHACGRLMNGRLLSSHLG